MPKGRMCAITLLFGLHAASQTQGTPRVWTVVCMQTQGTLSVDLKQLHLVESGAENLLLQ